MAERHDGRIRRSLRLTRVAWRLVRDDPAMLALAGLGVLFGLLGAAAIFWFAGYADHPVHPSRGRLMLVALIAAWPLTFVGTFFNVALAAAADAALCGRRLSFGQALAVSRAKVGQIALWSLLAAGVGQLLSQIAQRVPFGGKLAVWILGGAWSILTIFAVPVLALEGCGAVQCVRRSTHLVRERWGEGVSGTLTIGAATGLASMVPAMLLVGGFGLLRFAPVAGIGMLAAGLLGLLFLASLSGATRQVFAVALFRYAEDGSVRGGFHEEDLQRPFAARRRGLFRR
jgi:hypothetical protein